MVAMNRKLELGISQRAAEVRANWTLSERNRRTGLPPDAPETLWRIFSCEVSRAREKTQLYC
jgi:hypothetical protein